MLPLAARSRRALVAATLVALAPPAAAKKHKPKPKPFATRLVQSELSDPLPVTAGSDVVAQADCGGKGKVVSCGYQMAATAAQLSNVFVIAVAPADDTRAACVAHIARTSEVGSTPGARITAIALCLA
jgi:hypothetical protein